MAMAKRVVSKQSKTNNLPKFQPYYDFVSKTTKYGKNVWIWELPRKAKRS